MKLPISARLLACCNFIAPGERIADIGCDHGYLTIHLLQTGIARSVIASDIHERPLMSAIHNARKFGVQDKVEFYLSDGARNIPRDFDSMVCAGMGADTMISILKAAPWLQDSKYSLILQCQSKTPALRRYLSEQGFRIYEESVLRDGKFLYTVMEAGWHPEYPKLTPGEWYFPPALLENPSTEICAYYHWVKDGLKIAVTHRSESDSALKIALDELEMLVKNPALSWLEG